MKKSTTKGTATVTKESYNICMILINEFMFTKNSSSFQRLHAISLTASSITTDKKETDPRPSIL